ncbi:MAG: bifunctional aspartate kinase/diaminopimelate decarboxylase [Legionella sp.]|jgi:diaminopimelate decarboxylase/aspartate kinase
MQQIVTKFGGTSVSTRNTWDNIAAITQKHIAAGIQPVIVCSALTQISNKLEKAIDAALLNEHQTIYTDIQNSYLDLAESLEVDPELIAHDLHQLQQWLTGIALLQQAPAKTHAQILSMGELMMTRLGHAFLLSKDINNKWYDARELIVSTPMPHEEIANYLAAHCVSDYDPLLVKKFLTSGAQAIITQGFFAANPHGETVLLGRGGSDTSAAILAGKLQAAFCEIWTDVPGIYTANPHQLPHARLLKKLNYDEAQEIASMGAKVLHPNCIPPVRNAKIPMFVKYTQLPEHSGTLITKDIDETAPLIKSIQVKHSILLISIDTLNMWQQVGFLADVFATFKKHSFSVDLLSSSEFNVTISLDNNSKLHDREAINELLAELNQFGRAKLIEPCSAVSLVGHHIRTVLPQLGPALEVFEAKQVYLMSLASNDLNLTFVVDESQADKLCQKLHHLLIESNPQIFYYSKSWHEEFGQPTSRPTPWWELERDRLLSDFQPKSPCYVYHSPTQMHKAKQLLALQSVDALFYAIKANPHPAILKTLEQQGIGMECVSIQELDLVLELFPKMDKKRIIFTPNFAPKSEYEYALKVGCYITIDSLYPLEHWPDLLSHQDVILRIDPGTGAGHHKHVSTGGNESKFGITQNDLPRVLKLVEAQDINVVGLHAHSGSGILTADLWQQTALMLASLAEQFPNVVSINLGGGLGIVEKPGQHPIDFAALDASLLAVKSRYPNLQIWLEPGRFFVAESGVILAKVTQIKEKGKVKFIGLETGMNSLIRPSLYGAYHEIVNLSRLHEEKAGFSHIVGPICESGDTLGYDRLLPVTKEGDVLLIANTGAYGHCMSSHYNLRPPAQELVLE